MSFSIVEKIRKLHRGTHFIKADLHIHTPASKDWNDKNLEPQYHSSVIRPSDIVDAAIAKGLELIAITDHNSVEWCKRVIDAAKDTLLTVLPGFELTVNPGIHILAIFDKDKSITDLEDLLIGLGIPRDKFGYADAMTKSSLTDQDGNYKIVRELQNAGGLVIPAHIELEYSGLLGRLREGSAAEDFLLRAGCRFLEITRAEPPTIVSNILKDDLRRFSLIKNSDAHRLDRIGSNYTWLKLDSLSLESLKQICFEPLSRIRYDQNDPSKKAQIIGIFADGGILKDQVFAFNQDLNCIIGGRGAGKSALLDYLRFVLGDEPEAEELRDKYYKRLVDLVGHSTSVYVLVENTSNELWLYHRQLSLETGTQRGKVTYAMKSPPPTLYQVFIESGTTVKFSNSNNDFTVDFYSQGEVQSITNQAEPSRQLRLVDNFIRTNLGPREQKVAQLQTELEESEKKLTTIDTELADLKLNIDRLPEIETRIQELEASLDSENLKSYQVWQDANSWISKALIHLKTQQSQLDKIHFEDWDIQEFKLPDTHAEKAFDEFSDMINQAIKLFITAEESLRKEATALRKQVEQAKARWDTEFNKEKTRYEELLRQQGVANLAALNHELSEKRIQRDEISNRKKPHHSQLENEKATINKSRKSKLKQLYNEWTSIREARKMAAIQMTKRLNEEVKIEISETFVITDYHDKLSNALPSRTRKETIEAIASKILPQVLTDMIRTKQSKKLRESGFNENEIERIFQISESDLRELERIKCDDIAMIKLKIGKEYKDLSSLSEGEKCTAILSIILLDENRPLVIDQPEDELDHDFIMSNVVHTLAEVKQKCNMADQKFVPKQGRQFIIATHNQNIPALGDAELVIRMKKVMDTKLCQAMSSFGMDHPETIKQVLSLEGGRVAFERRREKYLGSTI